MQKFYVPFLLPNFKRDCLFSRFGPSGSFKQKRQQWTKSQHRCLQICMQCWAGVWHPPRESTTPSTSIGSKTVSQHPGVLAKSSCRSLSCCHCCRPTAVPATSKRKVDSSSLSQHCVLGHAYMHQCYLASIPVDLLQNGFRASGPK